MSSDRRSPWWPYLVLLAGLFVLSLAVPRGWQKKQIEQELETVVAPRAAADRRVASNPRAARVKPVIVRPNAETPLEAVRHEPARDGSIRPHRTEQPIGPTISPAAPSFAASSISTPEPAAQPILETVADKLASARQLVASQHVRRPLAPQMPAPTRAPAPSGPAEPAPALALNQQAEASPPLGPKLTDADLLDAVRNDMADADPSPMATWPAPTQLLAELEALSTSFGCRDWAAFVARQCHTLSATPIDQPIQATTILQSLQTAAEKANAIAAQLRDPAEIANLRRAQYALQRRLDTWRLIAECEARQAPYANVPSGDQQRRQLSDAHSKVIVYLESIPHGAAWAKYLALDEVGQLISASAPPVDATSRAMARRALLRIAPTQATPEQRQVLGDASLVELARALKVIAAEPIDRREVLAALEQFESNRLPSTGRILTVSQQNLLWSSDPKYAEIAQSIENHYRNANVRIALTADLLNRLAPEPITTYAPVNDVILGTPVRGQSVNTTEIRVRLIPDPQRIHLWLEASGVVDSHTKSTSGPATLINRGASDFQVRKAIVLDHRGLGMAQASTEADSRSRLTGVRTDYDGIPIVGPLVRNIAESQYDSMREQARWESRKKVAAAAGQRVDTEVEQRVAEAENRVRRELLMPLSGMNLELEPITLETASDRATMRLRLAGAHQLGGHTARPQAPSDSLASVQLHESAINNLLAELQLAGRTFDLPGLYRHLAKRLSRPEPKLPDDLPEGVQITFADRDPVHVKCDDECMRVTLAIKSLSQGSRQWHDFTIATTYKPEVVGRKAELVRDGHIELSGEAYKGRPEFALRGIAAKILSRDRSFPLLPPMVVDNPQLADVCVTQLTIEDGWIGMALGPDRAAHRSDVARQRAGAVK